MTAKQFLTTLQTMPQKWVHTVSGGLLRTDDCERPGYNDEAFLNYACPLTAVGKHVTGEYFSVSHYVEAAQALGLNPHVGRVIMKAADNDTSDIRYRVMRKQLEKAMGL